MSRSIRSEQWLSDIVIAIPLAPLLTREEFVQKYMPQYAREYEPPRGLRTYTHKKTGRIVVPQSTRGSINAQVSKRNNRIDDNYKRYKDTWESQNRINQTQT